MNLSTAGCKIFSDYDNCSLTKITHLKIGGQSIKILESKDNHYITMQHQNNYYAIPVSKINKALGYGIYFETKTDVEKNVWALEPEMFIRYF